jgi:hypothetical protein
MPYELALEYEQAQRLAQSFIAQEVREHIQRQEVSNTFGKGQICQRCLRIEQDCNCHEF